MNSPTEKKNIMHSFLVFIEVQHDIAWCIRKTKWQTFNEHCLVSSCKSITRPSLRFNLLFPLFSFLSLSFPVFHSHNDYYQKIETQHTEICKNENLRPKIAGKKFCYFFFFVINTWHCSFSLFFFYFQLL